MSNFLQVTQVAVEQSTADSKEVGVARVLNLNNTPWVLARAHLTVIDCHEVIGSNNGERHESTQLSVLLNGVLIILLNVVGEVVDGDTVVFDILHDQLLGLGQFSRSEGVGLSNNGDNVDTGREALHQFDIEFTQTVAGGCDEVKHDVHSVISEARVTLDSGFLCKNIIVLALEVTNNLTEAVRGVSQHAVSYGSGVRAWLRCQSGHRIRGYRRWSGRYGFPRHQVLALVSSKYGLDAEYCAWEEFD